MQQNKTPPKWITDKPHLAIGMNFYYEAFINLNTERNFDGKTVKGLSWSIIQRYADHYELDFEEGERFHYLIGKLDNAYCEQMSKKIK